MAVTASSATIAGAGNPSLPSPLSHSNCVTLSKAGRNKSADQFPFRANLILSACSLIMCHCQSVKQFCTTAVFTNQMNRRWTSNSPQKKIASVRPFMTVIQNRNRFDFWGSLSGLFFDVYKGWDCFIWLQTMQSFFLSRSVWIVIENKYPVLCSDNTQLLHQLNHVRHYLRCPFIEAPNQPKRLHKFPFIVVWTFGLIQFNMCKCPTYGERFSHDARPLLKVKHLSVSWCHPLASWQSFLLVCTAVYPRAIV